MCWHLVWSSPKLRGLNAWVVYTLVGLLLALMAHRSPAIILDLEKFSTVNGEYGYMHPFGILTQGGASSDNEVLFLPPHWRSYFWLAWRPSWHTQVPANKLLCTSISTLPSISYHSLLSSCASACCPCSVVQVLSLLEGAHKFLVTPRGCANKAFLANKDYVAHQRDCNPLWSVHKPRPGHNADQPWPSPSSSIW